MKELYGKDIDSGNELVFQEVISECEFVIKLYYRFEHTFLNFHNSLPFSAFSEFEEFDSVKITKSVMKVDESFIARLRRNFVVLRTEFEKYGIANCGMDLLYSKERNKLYLIDVNEDLLKYAKFNVKSILDFYKQNLQELFAKQ